jgi:hypothetical protein
LDWPTIYFPLSVLSTKLYVIQSMPCRNYGIDMFDKILYKQVS